MNPKLITWEVNKEATLNIEDALLSPKSMELVSGWATSVGSQTISFRQKTEWDTTGTTPVDKGDLYPLVCSSAGIINLAYAPAGAASAIRIYLSDDDCGNRVDMTGASVSGSTLTLGANGIAIAGGKQVIAYYDFASPATSESFVITSDKFSGTYKMVGTTVVRNAQTGKDEAFYVIIPNLKWTSNLELGFTAEGDPSTTSFECEIMRAANSSTMIQMVKV